MLHATGQDLTRLDRFVHRTFNGVDARQFVLGLRHLHVQYGGLENAFLDNGSIGDMAMAISRFKARFFKSIMNPEHASMWPTRQRAAMRSA